MLGTSQRGLNGRQEQGAHLWRPQVPPHQRHTQCPHVQRRDAVPQSLHVTDLGHEEHVVGVEHQEAQLRRHLLKQLPCQLSSRRAR